MEGMYDTKCCPQNVEGRGAGGCGQQRTPQLTIDTKSFSNTVMAAHYLLGADRSSVLSWVMATGGVTSGCRLSPAPHTEAHGAGAHI